MDAAKKFNGRAQDYTQGRPDYSPGLIECLYERYGFGEDSVIADIGSGTGKFARHLLEKGSTVLCVEPNNDMRLTAEKELSVYPHFRSVKGGAEDTTLKTDSVDFITTAQAFHWFDVQKFKAECSRILRSGGKSVLIWNIRDMNADLNRELFEIYTKFCPDFKGFGGGIKKDDERIVTFFGGRYDCISFDYPLHYDRERFIARSLSGSYSLKEGDKEYEKYIAAVEDCFERYSHNGTVTLGNHSVAYIGSI